MIRDRLRRTGFALLIVAMLPLLSGCWSKMEINNRSFITGVFIDADGAGGVEMTVLAPLPNRLGVTGGPTQNAASKGQPFAAVTKSAQTLQEAFKRIQTDLSRKMTFGQTRVVVVGRKYAESGIRELLEWGTRFPSFPLKCFVFVAPGEAKDIIKLTPVFEQVPSEVLREFANRHTLFNTRFKDVLVAATAKQGSVATMLTVGQAPMVSENNRMSTWIGTDGAALFQGHRLVGELNRREAMAIAWVKGSLQSPSYVVSSGEKGNVAVTLRHLKSRIRPFVRGGDVVMRVSLSAKASLDEVNGTQELDMPSDYHLLERRLAEEVESDLRSALRKSQSVRADVLQTGSRLEWRYPRIWNRLEGRWPDAYRDDIRFEIAANIQIMKYNDETKPLFEDK
ncbi:Ger(x)C family spore germination protein [Cohnella zeiphila]|uniref:Ger(X)C family spore germination protein n=1 Tax=Cohnella zeiphila TaxID=2761120 RepID=A0A7X0SPD3_9BACL|nr:Ger(x)C family spore germination protein [Cohnella zeiphila]MBB6733556.1 Ger(x)C family spore germination protein [Cohnella zeiphila]